MTYLYTGTTQNAGTNAGLSTQILVQVDGQSVGAIQSISSSQNRSVKRITEVGTDGTIELVPESATEIELSITRLVFDQKRLPEAFSRGFLNIHAQRIPFDIFVYDFTSARAEPEDPRQASLTSDFDTNLTQLGGLGIVTTIYENCWFTSLKMEIGADNYLLSETADVKVEFVHSFRDGNNTTPGSLATSKFDDKLEKVADMGRRGSLDARGLASVAALFSGVRGESLG